MTSTFGALWWAAALHGRAHRYKRYWLAWHRSFRWQRDQRVVDRITRV